MSPGVALGAMQLGDVLSILRACKPAIPLWIGSGRYRLTGMCSYRGHYEDVALLYDEEPYSTVYMAVALIERHLNKEITGHKGGRYVVDKSTGVWVSHSPDECFGEAVVKVILLPQAVMLATSRIDGP